MKNILQRTCMGCNVKKQKNELIRIIKTPEGKILLDKTGKLQGRGAYICRDEKCLNKIIKSQKIERIFKTKIDNEIYENIRGVIVDK